MNYNEFLQIKNEIWSYSLLSGFDFSWLFEYSKRKTPVYEFFNRFSTNFVAKGIGYMIECNFRDYKHNVFCIQAENSTYTQIFKLKSYQKLEFSSRKSIIDYVSNNYFVDNFKLSCFLKNQQNQKIRSDFTNLILNDCTEQDFNEFIFYYMLSGNEKPFNVKVFYNTEVK